MFLQRWRESSKLLSCSLYVITGAQYYKFLATVFVLAISRTSLFFFFIQVGTVHPVTDYENLIRNADAEAFGKGIVAFIIII